MKKEIKGSRNPENWDMIIRSESPFFYFKWKEIWHYRDLIFLLVHRDFTAVYKQTILGPFWFVVQPVFTTLVFTVIFSRVAKISTNEIPPVLFYMTGIIAWNYFSDCLLKTSNTFVANAGIFGKVYFPRIVVPLSVVISNLIKFGIQFLLLLGFIFFYSARGAEMNLNAWALLTPVLLIIMAGMGLGFGIIISSLTTKYRDFQNLVIFGVQLLMYATPIVYPLSLLEGKLRTLALLNPMTSIIETFKYAFLGGSPVHLINLGYSILFTIVLLLLGLLLFNKVEKNFIDTV